MVRNTKGLTKPKWKNVPTVAVRVPSVFVSQILAYARELDESGSEEKKSSDEG